MLGPEQIIERAKKWEIVFDAYDNQRPLKVRIEKELKKGYLARILELDLIGYLRTKKKFNINDEVLAIITSANYVNKQIELKLVDVLMDKEKILKILKKAKKLNKPIKARITNVANGGFEILVLGQKGFVPPSHIPKKFSENLYIHIGREYNVYILRANENNILASLRELNEN
ncbi:MAG: S1 RNA-binding domain-containing protein [candidate division WOR-3 bacterium]|jgi:ribosomal protein S1